MIWKILNHISINKHMSWYRRFEIDNYSINSLHHLSAVQWYVSVEHYCISTVLAAVGLQSQADPAVGVPVERQYPDVLSDDGLLEFVHHHTVSVRVPRESLERREHQCYMCVVCLTWCTNALLHLLCFPLDHKDADCWSWTQVAGEETSL